MAPRTKRVPKRYGIKINSSVGKGKTNHWRDVLEVKSLLLRHKETIGPMGFKVADSAFNNDVAEAIKTFQRKTFGWPNPDGVVSPRGDTIDALNDYPLNESPGEFHYPPIVQGVMIPEAARFLGVREHGDNRGGANPLLWEIFLADDLEVPVKKGSKRMRTDGYAWCTSLVSRCVQRIIVKYPAVYGHLTPPREASVVKFQNGWARENKCRFIVQREPEGPAWPGDVVVFNQYALGSSHIGVLVRTGKQGIWSIEGNTGLKKGYNGKYCMMVHRKWHEVDCFIRFPVPNDHTLYGQWGLTGPKENEWLEPPDTIWHDAAARANDFKRHNPRSTRRQMQKLKTYIVR